MTPDELMTLYKQWAPLTHQMMTAFMDARIANKTDAEGIAVINKASEDALHAFFSISEAVHLLKFGVTL